MQYIKKLLKRQEYLDRKDNMYIVLDDETTNFLAQLDDLRKAKDLSINDICEKFNFSRSTYYSYIRGNSTPRLGRLIDLAYFLEYDLRKSLNYRFYYQKLSTPDIWRDLNRYDLTLDELSEITRYPVTQLEWAIKMDYNSTHYAHSSILNVLHEIFKVINQERERRLIIRQILKKD